MIKLNHITKRFESGGRTVTAVDDVSLAINAGEVFGIIGFSGAGKSTLVRCINLLERPTSGEVIVDGVDLTQLDEKALRQVRQRIGMIFQHFNFALAHGDREHRNAAEADDAYACRTQGQDCVAFGAR